MFDICDAKAKDKTPSTFLAFDESESTTRARRPAVRPSRKRANTSTARASGRNESVVAFKNYRNAFTDAEKAYKPAQTNYQKAQDRLSRTNVSLQSK
jgi:hypothetical protein